LSTSPSKQIQEGGIAEGLPQGGLPLKPTEPSKLGLTRIFPATGWGMTMETTARMNRHLYTHRATLFAMISSLSREASACQLRFSPRQFTLAITGGYARFSTVP